MENFAMNPNQLMVSLGFTDEKVPVGSHICQIFSDDDERIDSLLKFLISGLQTGERATCFSERLNEETLSEIFSTQNISYNERKQNKAISLARSSDVYIQDNVFDPDRVLNTLSNYYKESLKSGFPAARVIGEVIPEIQNVPGGNRLIEYEARISMLLTECPITTVCQYDANSFDGATIMDVLRVHPLMVVGSTVVHNPFFIPAEEFLKKV